MAEQTTETRILEIVVDNSKATNRMVELSKTIEAQRKAQNDLKQAYKEGKITADEYYDGMVKTNSVIQMSQKEYRELNKEMQNTINMDRQKEGSLAGLRSELSNLTAAYDAMSEEERKSAAGLELQGKINAVTDKLKGAEEATQRWYRNVGNYANGMMDAFSKMGKGAQGVINPIKNVTSGLKVMSQTPVIAILGVLATVLNKVISSLSTSEETANRVTSALSIFGAAGTALTKILQKLGEGVAWVVEKLGAWADKLGLVTEQMKVQQQLTKDQIALDKQQREDSVENAKTSMEVSELRSKAAEKDKYTAEERRAFLQQAIDKETEMAEREKAAAEEQLRILEERAKLAGNSKEENEELAAARIKVYQVTEKLNTATRSLNKEMSTLNKTIADENKSASDAWMKRIEEKRKAEEKEWKDVWDLANDVLEQIKEETLDFENSLTEATDAEIEEARRLAERQYEIRSQEIETRLKLAAEGSEEELALKKEQLQRAFEMEMEQLASEDGTLELRQLKLQEYNAAVEALNKEHGDRLIAQDKEQVKVRKAAMSDLYKSLEGLMDELGDQNKALAVASKVMALAEIAVNTGKAIAAGTAAASGVAFPGNIAAIASTVATVLANITTAISTVKGAKFASGGTVTGAGSGTSDSIHARLSNGESVMTAAGTSLYAPLLSAMNVSAGGRPIYSPTPDYGRGMGVLSEAVAAGMQAADIRVGVDEISRKQASARRVKRIGVI